MKVVLFCGGLGMRLREYDENIPKPMVSIGYRPIMWHVMKYYAHFGHKDFVLALGYKADVIKQYFLNYNECLSNDFALRNGGEKVEVFHKDIHDWNITFADTGVNSAIGERLRRVKQYLGNDDIFLANYSDCLTDLPLPGLVDFFTKQKCIAAFVTVGPNVSYHYVSASGGLVTQFTDVRNSKLRVNGGFFVFRKEIFDHIREGEDLVEGAFPRLIANGQLAAFEYDGFWKAMDTFKDKQQFDELVARGHSPWEVWRK